jgi:hypothetical protein
LLLEKDERQYRSYLGNVNTLNQMKQAFKDVYPALKEANQGSERRMAGLILNYEKDLDEYASAWVNVKR